MNEFVPKKPVGSFNFVEPETTVVHVAERQPTVRLQQENSSVYKAPEIVDSKAISAIVRKFLDWNL